MKSPSVSGLFNVLLGWFIAITLVLPFIWMISTSLRSLGTIPPRTLELIPATRDLSNYREVFNILPLAKMLGNSLIVSGIAVPLSVVCAAWAGFVMLLVRPRYRKVLIGVALVAAMIPSTAFWVSRFVIFSQFGMIDTWWPLILPALTGTSPLFAVVFYWSYRSIPIEVFDAARLDGAGPLRVWATIAFPLSRPATLAMTLLVFRMNWNNFTDPLIYIQSASRQTFPFALSALYQLAPTGWPLLMAASVMLTVPAVAIFIIGQRVFTNTDRGAGWLGN